MLGRVRAVSGSADQFLGGEHGSTSADKRTAELMKMRHYIYWPRSVLRGYGTGRSRLRHRSPTSPRSWIYMSALNFI
ncbi:MAG: hypothetical protein V3R16_04655 [Nitrospirales bacterium]